MQQITRLSIPINAATAATTSLVLSNRRKTVVDRVMVTLQPLVAAGKTPLTADELAFFRQSIMVRWWLDANQMQGFVNGPVPVDQLFSPQMGPIPVRPFTLKDTDQFTLEMSATSALVFTDAASPYVLKLSSLNVVFSLWGNDDREA